MRRTTSRRSTFRRARFRRPGFRLDRALAFGVGAPVLALTTLLVGYKLLKLAPGYAAHAATAGSWAAAGSIVVGVGLAAGASLAGPRLWRRLRARGIGRMPLAAGLALALIVVVEGAAWALHGAPRGVTLRWLRYLRADVLFGLGLFAAGLAATAPLEGRWRSGGVWVVRLAAAALAFVATLEAAYFLRTGSLADWYLLQFSVRHADVVGSVLLREVEAGGWWVLAPPILVGLVPLLGRHRRVRRWLRDGRLRVRTRRSLALGAAAGVLLASGLGAASLPRNYELHRANVFAQLARDVAAQSGEAFAGAPPAPAADADLAGLALPSRSGPVRLVAGPERVGRNVVVVLLESVGARATTPYAPGLATTPFLDTLARRSLVVDALYANVPYTSDALLAVLGGLPPRLTSRAYYPDVAAAGLPALLAPFGYRSAVFTPAPLGVHGRADMLRGLGFEHVVGDGDVDASGFERPNHSGAEEHAVLAPSLAWADAVAARGERFLLTYLTVASHYDYGTPSWYEPHPFATGDAERDRYLNAVRYTDGFVEDLVGAFEARGLADSTVFVIVGDHGQAFGEHGFRYHGHAVWEEVIHVPALVYAPGLVAPRRVGGVWQQTDLAPTIVDLLGLRVAGGAFAGRSVLAPPVDRPLVFSATSDNAQMALRRGRHKFVYSYRRGPMQVFDVVRDPGETDDLAPTFAPAELRAAEAALLEARRRINAAYEAPADVVRSAATGTPRRP